MSVVAVDARDQPRYRRLMTRATMTTLARGLKRGAHARRVASALVATALGAASGAALEPPVRLPPGFRINTFAAGLGAPRFMTVDPAGTLLVSIPTQGRVVALPAGAGRGRADEAITVVAGLDRPHGLAVHQGHLYVAETGRVVRFRYDAPTRTVSDRTVIVADLPPGAHHWTRTVVIGPDGRIYVAIGSSCDICREHDRRRAAIVRYAPDGSGERLFATGLRNPVGLAFHPASGALWTTVNERDWLTGGAPPDYITEVSEGAWYGWPDCYVERQIAAPDPQFRSPGRCDAVRRPTLEIPRNSAPLGLVFYTGSQFPAEYQGSLFVAYHGSRTGLPPAGYKIVRITFRAGRPAGVEDFATGWHHADQVWGRPVDLALGRDGALYVSDDHAGAVHRVTFER